MLRDHFKTFSECQLDQEKNVNPLLINISVNEDINVEFISEEIEAIIKKLKDGKAYGTDHIRNEFLKTARWLNFGSVYKGFFQLSIKNRYNVSYTNMVYWEDPTIV